MILLLVTADAHKGLQRVNRETLYSLALLKSASVPGYALGQLLLHMDIAE